jgi:hypothetical protein
MEPWTGDGTVGHGGRAGYEMLVYLREDRIGVSTRQVELPDVRQICHDQACFDACISRPDFVLDQDVCVCWTERELVEDTEAQKPQLP